MRQLTLAYVTSRREPKSEWFFDSLARQVGVGPLPHIIVVDHYYSPDRFPHGAGYTGLIRNVAPKPTVWQGRFRLTQSDWWAKSNALNTAIILCQTEWIGFVDDRSVLAPGWMDSVRAAMHGNYAVCGSYEKRANLEVQDGIVTGGEMLGADTRTPGLYNFDSWYGGSGALPLEWCLAVQGFSEDLADGLGSEDSMFGVCLRNSGYPVKYDSRMRLIEDRTPGQIDGALKRADKGVGRAAKSWDIVRAFHGKKTSQNSFDLRNVRDRVLLNRESLDSIGPFGSGVDWYDGSPLSEMT